MTFLHIIGSIFCLSLCYAAVALVKHWVRVEQVTRRSLNLPVLNLEGENFAEAINAYYNDLRNLLQDGYRERKHGFYQLFSPTGYLTIASADFVQEMDRLPKGTLDFHSASQQVREEGVACLISRPLKGSKVVC